jgi:hypothetical protein
VPPDDVNSYPAAVVMSDIKAKQLGYAAPEEIRPSGGAVTMSP